LPQVGLRAIREAWADRKMGFSLERSLDPQAGRAFVELYGADGRSAWVT
jgi:hypothetical protein